MYIAPQLLTDKQERKERHPTKLTEYMYMQIYISHIYNLIFGLYLLLYVACYICMNWFVLFLYGW